MSATVVGERSQQLQALRRANDVRSFRSQLKRDLKAGDRPAVDVLLDPPAEAVQMRVVDFLVAVPRVGRVTANRVLWRLGCSPGKTLGGLTVRQRAELVRVLGGRDA